MRSSLTHAVISSSFISPKHKNKSLAGEEIYPSIKKPGMFAAALIVRLESVTKSRLLFTDVLQFKWT